MARECYFCNKKPLKGNNVSHANNKTIRRTLPNLRNVKALIGKTVKHVRACTRCIRSGLVVKAGKTGKAVS